MDRDTVLRLLDELQSAGLLTYTVGKARPDGCGQQLDIRGKVPLRDPQRDEVSRAAALMWRLLKSGELQKAEIAQRAKFAKA